MTITIHQADGTIKVLDSPRARRAVEILREQREAYGPSKGASALKEVLDRLDAEKAEIDRKEAEYQARRKDKGSGIDLAWLLCFPFSLFW
jgi:hypothetical protein